MSVLAYACIVHGVARADDDEPTEPAPAPAPEPEEPIVPPRLLSKVTPIYPEDEEGDAYVVVAVTVAASGAVDAVRVLEGLEPFASRAVEAVYQGKFAPATRGGKPIAAVIRFRIDFTKVVAPPPTPPPPPIVTTGEKPAVEAAAKPEEESVDDVLVRGGKSAMGATSSETISKTEVRQLPGAFGDPFRAIEVATGFTPIVSGLPYFYVRGAPPGNVGYYFDGVRVPYLFHFGLGPSVVHPGLIARTDIHKGGYPAALGRFAGGIVDAASLPPSQRLHGEGQLRVIDAGALLEVPFAKGKGSVLAGGRYAYTAALVGLIRADTKLDYRDYQTRIAYALGDRDTVSLFAFGAYDLASQRVPVDESTLAAAGRPTGAPVAEGATVERVLFASEFHRLDARWDHALGYGGKMRVAGTIGFDRTRLEARRSAEDFMTAARFDLVQPVSKYVLVRGGADIVVDRYKADALARYADDDDVVARQAKIFAARTDYAAGVRLDAVFVIAKRMELTPGIRLDRFESDGVTALGVDPRIAARFAVSKKVRIVHAYGIATQAPSSPLALPAITIARLDGGLQRAAQTSAGVEVDLPEDFSATATVFHNAFYDLNDALGTAQLEIIDIEKSDSLVGKTQGSAFGLELGVRRKLSRRVGGLLAYTLSRSLRTLNGKTFLSAYDRAHVFNAAISVDLGKSWRAGGRFVLYTGVPYTPQEASFAGQVVGIPPDRTPIFVRLDLRVEKRWRIGQNGWVAFVIEALNATLTREVTGYRCNTGIQFPGAPPPQTTCNERVVGPIAVPSIGVEGGF